MNFCTKNFFDQTSSGVLLGTPPYMAPEQAEGWAQAVGAATDVYALGVILYELLTGRLPFLGGSVLLTLERVRAARFEAPRRLRPEIPHDLETVCLNCLRRDPRQRYGTAAALADDLRRFLAHEPIRSRRPGPVAWLWDWCRRPERIGAAAVVALFFGAVTVGTNLAGLILVLVGVAPARDVHQAAFAFAGLLVAFGLPLLWVAWRTRARDVRALWTGLALPLLLPIFHLGSLVGLIPSGGVAEPTQDLNAWEAQVALLSCLEVFQAVTYIVALTSYYANRHVPGFLPDREPSPGIIDEGSRVGAQDQDARTS